MAGIYAMDILKNLTSTASSPVGPGSGSSRSLNVLSQHLNLTSPMGSDNFGDLRLAAKWKGVETDMRLTPTGKNLFIGGSGGFTLPSYGGDDYRTLIPGYTWYWGNPTMAVDGFITIDGKTSQIDTQNSFGYFERQWGDFNLTAGYVAVWAHLPNGDLLHTWVVEPDVNGHGSQAISTVWHPDGRHEVLAVDFTRGSDIWVSKETGKNYFTEFEVGSSTAHSRLRMRQYSQATEVLPENDQGSIISEAYGEGEGTWEGQPVKFFGHLEQYSSWYWL
ncbi:hypothetical protein BFJ63_vAg18378 [Fusarium oxysporum f. sp. narcissi]|uniref:AttH domain-containing protein n=1 Tax=Fusarium oxysporum f. sp. narcissi TaxID=451672 RepID=A0A4Q2V4H0_FUSOX|nr:hypothetical protein BFJ63_vAg18378 [Fusarium oxysporum f. sp. narcissi]